MISPAAAAIGPIAPFGSSAVVDPGSVG